MVSIKTLPPISSTSGLVSPIVSSLTSTASGASIARTFSNRFADTVNVRDFGAVGDGTLRTIGATLGVTGLASLAAIPAYSWATNPLAGLRFTMNTTASAANGATALTFLDALTGINGWSANAAKWLNPATGNFLVSVGMLVSGAGIAAGATVTAINSDMTSANYGQITLSTGTTASVSSGTAITFTLPDSAIVNLSMDCLGWQAAVFAVQGSSFYRSVYSPGGYYISNHATMLPSFVTDTTTFSGATRIFGDGGRGQTVLITNSDLGRGHALIKEANCLGQNSAFLQMENIQLRYVGGSVAASGFGNLPAQMDLIKCGPKARIINCGGSGARAGIAHVGEHQTYNDCDFRNNGYNIMFDDFSTIIGNQKIIGCELAGAAIASIGIAATNQCDSALMELIHTGSAPLSVYKEPAGLNVTTGLNGTITNTTLTEVAVEAIGVGFIGGPGANNQCANNRWNGGGCGQTVFNSSFAPASGSTLAVALGGTTPTAMINCARFSLLTSNGFDFNPVGTGVPAIKTTGDLFENTFNDCLGVVQNVNTSVAAFQWGGVFAQNNWKNALGRGSFLYANNALGAGMPVRESENGQALVFAPGFPFTGVTPVAVAVGQSVAIWKEAVGITVTKADATDVISGGPPMFPTANGFARAPDSTGCPGFAVGGSGNGTTTVTMALSPNADAANAKVQTGLSAATTNTLSSLNQYGTSGATAQALPTYAPPGWSCQISNDTGSVINVSANSIIVGNSTGTTDTVAAGAKATYRATNTLKQWIRAA